MNNVIKHPERPRKNLLWQTLPHPAQSDLQDEAIAHGEAGILKRSLHCGSLEAE